eukprot:1746225-Pleurochrysis_carterae.AAC.1
MQKFADQAQASRRAVSMRDRRRPAQLLKVEATQALEASFKLTDTGTFVRAGFTISSSGIKSTPVGRRGDFSHLNIDQLEILEDLGSGECGSVRLAKHMPSGKLLALKQISVADRGQRHQLLNELRVLCGLQHVNLLPMFDAFYRDGALFLALKYKDA